LVASFVLPWIFPWRAGVKASTEVFTAGYLLLWFRNFTASEAGKQVTETPTSGKLCGELFSALNRDQKAQKTNRLLHQNFLRKIFRRRQKS
jgi:hypothetical protein